MDRWKEYNAGTLKDPAILQCDQIGKEILVWGLTSVGIIGPISRSKFNEEELLKFFGSYEPLLQEPLTPNEILINNKISFSEAKIVSENKLDGTITIELKKQLYDKIVDTSAMTAEEKV